LQQESEWKIIFYIAAGIYIFGCVIYWFFCEGTIQPWAEVRQNIESTRSDSNKFKDGAINEESKI
jgi:ACS family sodium-dependent inorganic phosphate cotransporter